jgi:hypothetical protein
MKLNAVLILAATTTLPIEALADPAGCPKGDRETNRTYATVLLDGKKYNVEVDNFFYDVRYGELPDGRWVALD